MRLVPGRAGSSVPWASSFRKELQAQPEGPQREALFQRLVNEAVERGQALNMASHLEIDEVIDPAETRDWLLRQLAVAG